MDPNETEITFDDNGQLQGLEAPAPEATDDGWQDGAEGAPAPAPAPEEPEAAPEGEEEDQVAPEDDGWEDTTKPETKPDPDDVPPEDRDPKGKVPSWRVREIRAQKDAEIQRLQAELEAVKSGKAPAQQQPQAAQRPLAATPDDELIQAITERDPVIQDCDAKLQAIQVLVETAPEELTKYFRNADHMAAEIAKLTATRQTRINTTISQMEQQHAQQARSQQEQQEAYVAKIAVDYDTAIKTSKIPDIIKYAQRIASNADRLNVGIREMVLTSDDKDVVTAVIGSNRKLFDELASVDPRKPMTAVQLAHVALKLGKAVAAYQAPKQSVIDEPEPQPQRTVQPTATRRASRPTSVPRYRVEKDGTIVL